jgi:hypothetical protein
LVVLTSPWHERDAETLAEQLGAAVYAPPADTAQDLIDKFGITALAAYGGPALAAHGGPADRAALECALS